MKKEQPIEYNDTNFTGSPIYKEYKKRRLKEKISRFVLLPTFLWTITFFVVSLVLLIMSYFVDQSSSWLSGVLVSIACGIITGIILYFLSNLRSVKISVLQMKFDEIMLLNDLVYDVLNEKVVIENSELLGVGYTLPEKCKMIMTKVDKLWTSMDIYDLDGFYQKNGLRNFIEIVEDIWNQYYRLSCDEDREKWIDDIILKLSPICEIIDLITDEYCDKLSFMKKYVF